MLFLPLNFDGKGFQHQFTTFIFKDLIEIIQNYFFENGLKNIDFSSDTIGLNLLLVLLLVIGFFTTILLNVFKFNFSKIIPVTNVIIAYYIAYVLLNYGFNKVFKAQFYLPEPNILFTKFGDLSKDILYWSTIGTSRLYNVLTGSLEVIAAVLILINRTRIFGLLVGIGIFLNVIFINFGFDISVKTFSVFLFLASVFVIFPYLNSIYSFFILKKETKITDEIVPFSVDISIKHGLKFFIIGLLFLNVVYPHFKTNNWNDDRFPRPFLHGIYKITQIISNNDTIPECDFTIKNIVIHRSNYLIFQDQNDLTTDYYFEINYLNKTLEITDYQKRKRKINYFYSPKDSVLQLYFIDKKNLTITCKAINWRKFPALLNDFHFTIDQLK